MSEEFDVSEFIEASNPEEVSKEIWRNFNKIYGSLAHLVNYRFHLTLYRLMQRVNEKELIGKRITMQDIADCADISKARLFFIKETFEKYEQDRMYEKAGDQNTV